MKGRAVAINVMEQSVLNQKNEILNPLVFVGVYILNILCLSF